MSFLSTAGLTKYFGGVAAVSNVSLEVAAGEVRALIGPNGSGKSTFLNLLSGIYQPSSGKVLFGGVEVSGLPPHQVARRGISRTFQNIRLFKGMTVLDNVMAGRDWLRRDGLWDCIARNRRSRDEERSGEEAARLACENVGITPLLQVQADSLSYGLQRRVEIARALAAAPKLLLLDEPAAGMNPPEVADLAKQIRRIRDGGLAVLLIEHNMRFVMDLADGVTVFDHGEKIFDGTPQAARNDERVIGAYLGKADAAA